MAILNEAYVFDRDASPDARMAFSAPPKKTLFNPGIEFRRFITAENRRSGERGNQIFGSPWWFTKQTFQRLVAHADPRGLGIGDIARIDLAVPKAFNTKMEWICVIYLTQSVYAWTGKAARQPAAEHSNIYLGGGGEQIFLPNLASDPLATTSKHARMRFFGMCPDYF